MLSSMNLFSYKIEHDFGLAPNPFGGYCTLAVCKGQIRSNKRLEIGDWIIGTGSRALERVSGKVQMPHLIYAMQVEEKLNFNQYWLDPRFQYKKPVLNGSLTQLYGDNIYHTDNENNWVQVNSAHSLECGNPNLEHVKRDTKSDIVLITKKFFYFGNSSELIPIKYESVLCKGRGVKSTSIPQEVASEFIAWLEENFKPGIYGDPINWIKHIKNEQ